MEQKKKLGCSFRGVLWGIVIVGGLVLGFIFLMRSCLSKWDTYAVMGWPGITDDEKTMVIVKAYSKTTNYSYRNGITHKSYNTTFYIEKIDIATGKIIQKNKLMNHRKIKKGELQCYGGYKNWMWIFANYLRAYDMNTLEQVVKLEDIENKNPQLKGKMPVESQYYDAHVNLGYITITAQDGDKYNIMLDDLHAELIDPDADSFDKFSKNFDKQQEAVQASIDSLNNTYQSNYTNAKEIYKQRDGFYKVRDSLRRFETNSREVFQTQQDLKRRLEDFDTWSSTSISDWTIMQDTLKGRGYILNKEEPNSRYFDLVNISSLGSESDKVKLYKIIIEPNKESHSTYDAYNVTKVELLNDQRYLQGGVMCNYKTANAYHTINPYGFIIFSRDIIGNKGKLLVTKVDLTGKQLWQTNAEMSYKITFTMATNNYLIIVGVINQEKTPVTGTADALRIIDLKTGSLITVKY